jgi:hypothetical protein
VVVCPLIDSFGWWRLLGHRGHNEDFGFGLSFAKGNVRAFNPVSSETGDSSKSQAHSKLRAIFILIFIASSVPKFSEECDLKASERRTQRLICNGERSGRSPRSFAGLSCGSSFFFRDLFQLLDGSELLERYGNSWWNEEIHNSLWFGLGDEELSEGKMVHMERFPFVFSDSFPMFIVSESEMISKEKLGTFFGLPGLSHGFFFSSWFHLLEKVQEMPPTIE